MDSRYGLDSDNSSISNIQSLAATNQRGNHVNRRSNLPVTGTTLTSAGVIEFRSIRRLSGMETSKLITTGIYHWSRNPQFLGFYLTLLGITLLGSSGYALLLTITAITYYHYIINIEEPHLKHIFRRE